MTPGYRLYRTVLLTLLIATFGLYVVQTFGSRSTDVAAQLDLLVDVRHEILSEFVEEVDQDRLIDAAVRAMVSSLEDPYTVYLSAEELEPFDKRIRGSFSGIGAEVDLDEKESRLRIVTPLEDSPAWKAGVMAGDIVLEIDGQSTEGLSINECVNRLTGKEGTDVTIKVRHLDGTFATLTITRARINVQTVRGLSRDAQQHWRYIIDPERKVAYIRLTQFTESTTRDLRAALTELKQQGMAGLILDMRFNPGGLLTEAVGVSDLFLPEGKTIVTVRGRKPGDERVTQSTSDVLLADLPVVVLINEFSASASEIVAGALKDNARAHLVGTRTFGKGSVQAVKSLPSGQGAIKITHAYYYIPTGRTIHKKPDAKEWGVDPADGAYVPMSPQAMREMARVRREGDILKPEAGDELLTITPTVARDTLKDPQLAAAIEAILGKLKADTWPQVGERGTDELVRKQEIESLTAQRDIIEKRLQELNERLEKLGSGEAVQPSDAPTP